MTTDPGQATGGPSDPGRDVLTGAAWRAFCERMADLGDRILSEDFPGGGPGSGGERDRAEGFRHLANQVACWLSYQLAATEPEHPALFTHNNLVYRWGGPNVDQNARRAPLAGDGVYRLTVSMNGCDKFIAQVKAGNMHMGVKGVFAEVDSEDLGLGPGDTARIIVSAERPDGWDGPWIRLDPGGTLLHVRDYYFGWQAAQPAMFAIERLDTQGTPRAELTPERVAGILDGAAEMVERSVEYWNTWMEDASSGRPPNTFSDPGHVEGGVGGILYAFADVRLAPDQALVVEVDPGQARQWNVQLQSFGWFESLDFPNRVTSLNFRQVHRAADGRAHLVIAGTDPGVPNWLDTEGRERVFCTHRWVAAHETPFLRAEVVPLGRVRDRLPDGTPEVTPDQRREEVRARAEHVAWRFRA